MPISRPEVTVLTIADLRQVTYIDPDVYERIDIEASVISKDGSRWFSLVRELTPKSLYTNSGYYPYFVLSAIDRMKKRIVAKQDFYNDTSDIPDDRFSISLIPRALVILDRDSIKPGREYYVVNITIVTNFGTFVRSHFLKDRPKEISLDMFKNEIEELEEQMIIQGLDLDRDHESRKKRTFISLDRRVGKKPDNVQLEYKPRGY